MCRGSAGRRLRAGGQVQRRRRRLAAWRRMHPGQQRLLAHLRACHLRLPLRTWVDGPCRRNQRHSRAGYFTSWQQHANGSSHGAVTGGRRRTPYWQLARRAHPRRRAGVREAIQHLCTCGATGRQRQGSEQGTLCSAPAGSAARRWPPLTLHPRSVAAPAAQPGQALRTSTVAPSMRPGSAGKPTAAQPPAGACRPTASVAVPLGCGPNRLHIRLNSRPLRATGVQAEKLRRAPPTSRAQLEGGAAGA